MIKGVPCSISLTLTSPVVKNYLLRPQHSLRRRRWMRAQRHDQGDRVDEDRGQERELIEGQGKTRRRVLLESKQRGRQPDQSPPRIMKGNPRPVIMRNRPMACCWGR